MFSVVLMILPFAGYIREWQVYMAPMPFVMIFQFGIPLVQPAFSSRHLIFLVRLCMTDDI